MFFTRDARFKIAMSIIHQVSQLLDKQSPMAPKAPVCHKGKLLALLSINCKQELE
jgi:hypothetical protein